MNKIKIASGVLAVGMLFVSSMAFAEDGHAKFPKNASLTDAQKSCIMAVKTTRAQAFASASQAYSTAIKTANSSFTTSMKAHKGKDGKDARMTSIKAMKDAKKAALKTFKDAKHVADTSFSTARANCLK